MIVAIICPRCNDMVTETYPHPLNMPCFVCQKCKLVLEPPNGMRAEILATSLVDGSTLPSRLPWNDGRAREKRRTEHEKREWKRVQGEMRGDYARRTR